MKKTKIKKRKGFTLIELMVAMSIFVIVTTLAVGGFVAVNNLKAVAMTNKESQQKIRIGMEMISRYARQAEYVKISSTVGNFTEDSVALGTSGNVLELYFNLNNYDKTGTTIPIATKDYRRGIQFMISGSLLTYKECTSITVTTPPTCTTWGGGNNILGNELSLKSDQTKITESRFTMNKKSTDLINSPATDQDTFVPPTLTIRLLGEIGSGVSNQNYKDTFSLETRVILNRLK